MKTIIIALVAGLMPLLSTGQDFQKYESMKDVDAWIMTSKMFKMLAKVDLSEGDPETQQYMKMIENLDQIRMFTTKNSKVQSQMAADVRDYLKKGSLDQLMQLNESGKNVRFYTKPGKNEDIVSELFMFMEGKKEGEPISVILSITGDIDLSQLSKLTETLKVPGTRELAKIENKS